MTKCMKYRELSEYIQIFVTQIMTTRLTVLQYIYFHNKNHFIGPTQVLSKHLRIQYYVNFKTAFFVHDLQDVQSSYLCTDSLATSGEVTHQREGDL